RTVAGRQRVGDTGTARDREELGAEADETAARNGELDADPARSVVRHRLHAALAGGEQLRDRAEVLLRRVDRELLPRLGGLTVLVLAGHDLRLADRELEALAAHVLDEDRELKLTATLHLPRVRATDVIHADRHVTD